MIDHKKLAAAVVDVLPPPEKLGKQSPDDSEGGDGSDMGAEEAVKAFFAAGKLGDFAKAYKALEQAVALCKDDGGDDSGESNSEPWPSPSKT